MERYYGHVQRLDRLDIANFLARMREVLPRYRSGSPVRGNTHASGSGSPMAKARARLG